MDHLRLWDNHHGTCPTTPITVTAITGGTPSALSVGCTALKITLPSPLAQGQSATISFDLGIVVPSGADRFGHDGAYTMDEYTSPWLDESFTDYATDLAMSTLLKIYAQSHWYGLSTTADFKAAAQAADGSTDLTSFRAQHRVEG